MNNLNFRAWHKEEKKMYPVASILIKPQLIVFDHDYEKLINTRCSHIQDLHTKLDQVILMQSIGFKDFKGIEIFFDDLVEFENEIYSVDWDKDGSKIVLNRENTGFYLVSFCEKVKRSIKVIGNIYEQPEFLEVGNE